MPFINDVIKKQIKMKKIKKNDPLIIKKRAKVLKLIELNILFNNSLFIIFFQNFVLVFLIYLKFYYNLFH